LSWLWNTLNSIVSTLNSWFSTLWEQAQNITNTGQGIFSGLVAFGSQIWDAILKGLDTFGSWLASAYNYIKTGIENLGSALATAFNSALTFIGQGVAWFGSQLYNLGNWVYNGLVYVYNWIVNTITGLWNGLVSWFSNIATGLNNWWASVTSTINNWLPNLLVGFRNKLIQTIQADLTITMAWKGAESFFTAKSFKELGFSLLGMALSPIVSRLVGVIIDSVIPTPSVAEYPLAPSVPSISISPPSISVETPTPPSAPSPEVTGVPTGYFTGVSEKEISIPNPTYEIRWDAGQDLSLSLGLDYETEVA